MIYVHTQDGFNYTNIISPSYHRTYIISNVKLKVKQLSTTQIKHHGNNNNTHAYVWRSVEVFEEDAEKVFHEVQSVVLK